MRHLLRLALAALALAAPAVPSPVQGQLLVTDYKFNDPRLLAMGLDGSGAGDLFAPANPFPSGDWLPVGLAVDPLAGRVYWTHGSFNTGLIRSANLDGSGQTLLLSGLKLPRGVALDSGGGKLYWSNSPAAGNAGGIVERANLDGSGRELVYAITPYDPVSSKIGRPTVDATNGYAYFGANDAIVRVNLDGPPFTPQVVTRGASTPTRIALDVASGHLYWIDSDTISDCVVRVDLDGSRFTVVHDSTPGSIESSGLIDLLLDRNAGKVYLADEIGQKGVRRMDADGASVETIYPTPAGWSSSSLAFDVEAPQALLDCNGNGVRDLDDVASGTSADCDGDGIPDECELEPCAPPVRHLDSGLDLSTAPFALGGTTSGTGWVVFQPFDVPAGGWQVGGLELDGRTTSYAPGGFVATVFPDTGASYPDESQPLMQGSGLFRFGETWVPVELSGALPAGRHWVRVAASGAYQAQVYAGQSGPGSFSRSNLGNDFAHAQPIAFRVLPPPAVASFCAGDGSGAACPCGNESAAGDGRGCRNSGGAGARLSAAGSASASADDLRLTATSLLPAQPALLFAGLNAVAGGAGAPFGDGLRCAGGGVVRLGVRAPDALGVARWGPGLGAVGGWTAGERRLLQVWYRDPQGSPCGAGFNLTNGLDVTFGG